MTDNAPKIEVQRLGDRERLEAYLQGVAKETGAVVKLETASRELGHDLHCLTLSNSDLIRWVQDENVNARDAYLIALALCDVNGERVFTTDADQVARVKGYPAYWVATVSANIVEVNKLITRVNEAKKS